MRITPLLLPLLLATTLHAGETPVDIPQLAASPTCDGSIAIGEYQGAFSLALDGLTPSANPGWNPYNANSFAPANLSYTFYVAHDGAALYVAFDITDDSASSTRFPNPNMGNVSV